MWCKYAVYGDENLTDGSFIRRFPFVLSYPSIPSYTSRMNRIFAPIFLLTLLFSSLAIGETMNDLMVRDGLHYKKITDVPFTGNVTGNYQGSFRNGKEDGPWVSYYDNGQLWFKGNYKDGKKDGPWVFYLKYGQLFYKGTFKDGKKDGPWVYYWRNGTVNEKYKGTHKNGVEVK